MSERFSLDTLYRGHALVLSTVFVIGVFSRFFVKWHGQEDKTAKKFTTAFFCQFTRVTRQTENVQSSRDLAHVAMKNSTASPLNCCSLEGCRY